MSRTRCLVLVASLLGLFGCDHGTKHLAKVHLSGRDNVELIPGVFGLNYTENTDTAFSLLGGLLNADLRYLLISTLGSVGMLAFVVFIGRRWAELSAWQRAGAVLVLGGGLGNLTDRILRGYVIDFLHLHSWPVFNVADIALCAGVPLLLLFSRKPGAAALVPSTS